MSHGIKLFVAAGIAALSLGRAAWAADETSAIQSRIDAVWQAGGGEVVVAAGRHEIGGLRLRSGITLRLAAGAEIVATRDVSRYDVYGSETLEPLPAHEMSDLDAINTRRKQDGSLDPRFLTTAGSSWNRGIFCAYGATNVAVVGEAGSSIDGQNAYDPTGEEGYRGVHGFSFFHCTNVVFRGFEIRHAGNWAMRLQYCADVVCTNVTALGGHDGFHARGSDRILVAGCRFLTGDDCVAGFDDSDVTVRGCTFSSACNVFRLGGCNVLIEDCTATSPCPYPFRGSLTTAQKSAGTWRKADLPNARYVTEAFYAYLCDETQPVRATPGNIVIRNCRAENVQRFVRYNYGGETWQHACPVSDLTIENCTATGLLMPLVANAGATGEAGYVPFVLKLRDSTFAFARTVDAFVECLNAARLDFTNVTVTGVTALPAAANWAGTPQLAFTDVTGIRPVVIPRTGTYSCTLRFLESTGTQYVKTGIVPNGAVPKAQVKYQFTARTDNK